MYRALLFSRDSPRLVTTALKEFSEEYDLSQTANFKLLLEILCNYFNVITPLV